MKFKLGLVEKRIVCRQSFRYVHNISRDHLNTLSSEIKTKKLNLERPFNDRSNPKIWKDERFQAYCRETSEKFGIELTPDQRAAQVINNSTEALECWAWMKYYFELVGDFQPNSNGEIHLEPCFVSTIWLVYQRDQLACNKLSFLDYKKFAELWVKCFP
jgi:hypothetical protein